MAILLHRITPRFGPRLRAMRKTKNLSQKGLGAIVGVHQAQISAWEKETYLSCKFISLNAICQALNISADYLIGVNDVPSPLK